MALALLFIDIWSILRSIFDNIVKFMYLLYTSLGCLLDILQLFMRKVAGLDVYYDALGNEQTGDIVTDFIEGIIGIGDSSYSTLSTVFYSFIILGIILLFMSTLLGIIKMHFNYDEAVKAGTTSPLKIVGTAAKSLMMMIAVPLITVLGLWISEALLVAMDSITSVTSSSVEDLYPNADSILDTPEVSNSKKTTYFGYDFFGYRVASSNVSFSGTIFQSAAYSANRVRTGDFSAGDFPGWTGFSKVSIGGNQLFSAEDSPTLATQIDYAFMGNLKLINQSSAVLTYDNDSCWIAIDTLNFFYTTSFQNFSKFNVGLVFYYYNLWQFNFLVGFAAIVVCFGLFVNITIGLIIRIFLTIGLFLISPLFIGLTPLDGGQAFGKWKRKFIGYVIMAYGSILGMNIFFLIFPEIQRIRWFNLSGGVEVQNTHFATKNILDVLVDVIVIIVGLLTIKKFIAVVSEFVGAENAEAAGGEVSQEVGQAAAKAGKLLVGAAMTVGTIALTCTGVGAAASGAAAAAKQAAAKTIAKKAQKVAQKAKKVADVKKKMELQQKAMKMQQKAQKIQQSAQNSTDRFKKFVNPLNAVQDVAGYLGGGVKQMLTENTKVGKGFIDGWGKDATNPSQWFKRRPNFKANALAERQKQDQINQQTIDTIDDILGN